MSFLKNLREILDFAKFSEMFLRNFLRNLQLNFVTSELYSLDFESLSTLWNCFKRDLCKLLEAVTSKITPAHFFNKVSDSWKFQKVAEFFRIFQTISDNFKKNLCNRLLPAFKPIYCAWRLMESSGCQIEAGRGRRVSWRQRARAEPLLRWTTRRLGASALAGRLRSNGGPLAFDDMTRRSLESSTIYFLLQKVHSEAHTSSILLYQPTIAFWMRCVIVMVGASDCLQQTMSCRMKLSVVVLLVEVLAERSFAPSDCCPLIIWLTFRIIETKFLNNSV